MKKIISLLFLLLIVSSVSFSQNENFEKSIFENAEFIFEGKIIEYKTFHNDSTMKSHTVYKIEISHIFRGENTLNTGTVKIVREGSDCGVDENGDFFFLHSSHEYRPPNAGIYFCSLSALPQVGKEVCVFEEYDYYAPTNKPTLNILEGINFRTKTGIGRRFNNKQEIYDYLGKQDDIVISPLEQSKKKDAADSVVKKEKHKIDYAEKKIHAKKYEERLQGKISVINEKDKDVDNVCKEFFISEYLDGPNKNKVLEIYNPSDGFKSLDGYTLRIYQNGAPTPLIIPLSGVVASKETFVIAHPKADSPILSKADITPNKMNFDGNDAIMLTNNQAISIDKIGEIGVNPGQGGWDVPPSASTKEQNLRRKFPVDKGETDWSQGRMEWKAFHVDSVSNIRHHENRCISRAVQDVTYSFANPQETGTNPRYFEFDIMIEGSTNETYLDNAAFYIQYNPTAFGNNIVANNKIILTKGANFDIPTYEDPNMVLLDETADVFNFYFGSDFNQSSWNRTLVTTSPQQLVHVKMEVANCNENTSLEFINQTQTANASLYTYNPTEDFFGTFNIYDDTYYINTLNQTLCELKIYNFTNPVYPGTYYEGTTTEEWKLTINGSGFGDTRGSGNVYFPNADDGGQTYISLNDYDSTVWSDNNIQIIMPSVINTVNLPSYEPSTPGSGPFYVKTNLGDSVFSNTPIDLPYAIENVLFPSQEKKIRMDLANVNSSDSAAITFMLDTSITNNPAAEAAIRKAVRTWRCETLVYFEVGTDTSLTSAPDGVSVIHFTNSLSSSTYLAVTRKYTNSVIQCLDNNINKHIFPKEIDISFLRTPNYPWYFDTTGALPANMYDFYEVALHEVGHGNVLKHVLAPSTSTNDEELMYWQARISPTIISEGNRRTINASARNGGYDVVQHSNELNIDFSTCNTSNVETLLLSPDESCGAITAGFGKISETDFDFSLFPNPTKGEIIVSYELKANSTVQFSLYDYLGREIYHFKEQKNSGKHDEQRIDMANFPSGLYLLVGNINGNLQTFKIVKQ